MRRAETHESCARLGALGTLLWSEPPAQGRSDTVAEHGRALVRRAQLLRHHEVVSNSIDENLATWSTLIDGDWATLLLGNGMSINLWIGFGYKSLYAAASLSDEAKAIFSELGTTNFEQCLECLHHANIVLRALRKSTVQVNHTYETVKDALFDTIGEIHVPWDRFPADTHVLIASEIDKFRSVFTTN